MSSSASEIPSLSEAPSTLSGMPSESAPHSSTSEMPSLSESEAMLSAVPSESAIAGGVCGAVVVGVSIDVVSNVVEVCVVGTLVHVRDAVFF
jgi:hypothetical protein